MIGTWILLWIPLVFVAILNGTLREKGFAKLMAELPAHQLSTLTGILLVGLYVWIVMKYWPIASAGSALLIGGIWFVMTVLFEFGFGHFVMGHPWERLLRDYNIFAGRLWVLFLLWTTFSPWAVFLIQERIARQ